MLVQHTMREERRENHFALTENTCPDWNESKHLGQSKESTCAHLLCLQTK